MFVSEVEDGWARGELEDGSIGLYPTNFVLVNLVFFCEKSPTIIQWASRITVARLIDSRLK